MSKHQEQGFGVYAVESGRQVSLAMQELWLTGTVLPVGARLAVRHCFRSKEKKPLEAIYAFGLPRDAAMRRFRIVGEGFTVESALKPSQEARQVYESGLEEGHLSALAQQYKDGMVNLNLGNIRPGETVTVYIEIAAGVACTENGFRFRFPFTLAPGYHARAATGSADSEEGEISLPEDVFGDIILPRWKRDAKGLHRVGFDLTLALSGEDMEIASPSHAISVRMGSSSFPKVTLSVENDVPNRDLVLDAHYALKKPCLLSGLDISGKGRFAAIVPPSCFGPVPEKPKQVVFLIDRSGSMDGRPFNQAKQATLACIAALRPQDRFGIVFFESSVMTFPGGCVAADQEQRDAARAFVNKMETAGGTELYDGIHEAASLLPKGGDILLLTDGQVYDTGSIVARARKAGVRIHCLGIGSASQDRFLALLARETGGACHFATPRERVDAAALRLFSTIVSLAAEHLSCAITGMQEARLLPEVPVFVRAKEPLVLFGSCNGAGSGVLHLNWDGGHLDVPATINEVPCRSVGTDAPDESGIAGTLGETLKLIQGARITTEVETMETEEAETRRTAARLEKRREKRWIALAAEYGLANPAMSLVAIVERAGDQPGDVPVTRVVPVGMPQDTGFAGYFNVGHRAVSAIAGSVARHALSACMPVPPGFDARKSRVRSTGTPIQLNEDVHAMREIPEEDRILDWLFEITGTLDVDGGLPGSDMDERIVRTLAGLLALLGYERNTGEQTFAAHARLMREFLQVHIAESLQAEHDALLNQALTMIDRDQLPEADWVRLFMQPGKKNSADQLWNEIKRTLPATQET